MWIYLKPPEGSQVRYFAKSGKRTTGGVIKDAEHLAFLMATFREKGWDAYIQPNPSNGKKKRSSAKDITHYRWFTMDIDPTSQPTPTATFEMNVPAPLVGKQTTCIYVKTGRGIQLWWRAMQLEIPNDRQREALRYANACMLKETFLDDPRWKVDFLPDLPRLVRMPQTINSKTGQLAEVVGWPMEGAEYLRPDKMMEWAGDPPPPPEPVTLVNDKWQNALPHLSLTAKTFIMEGVDSKDTDSPGRHHSAVAAARSLRDANLPYDCALVAVLRGARRCCPALDEDNSFTTYEVMRIVSQAYGIEG